MTERIPSKRGATILLHSEVSIDDARIMNLLQSCSPSVSPSGLKIDEAYFQEALATLKRWEYKSPVSIPRYPFSPWPSLGSMNINFYVRAASMYELSNKRKVPLPFLAREPDRWLKMGTNGNTLDLQSAAESAWLLEKVLAPVEVLQPDFGFGDTDVNVADRTGEADPRRFAWPLLIYGPEMVKRFGRERLLKTPVRKAQELPYGGVWLQLTETPFNTTPAQVSALADYLGLERPAK